MSREKKEVKTYFGRCRCCLGYGYLNNMWEEYSNGDEIEVYGEMLVQCYALSWEHPVSVDMDQICDKCVERLRSAYDFKKLVIESQSELMQEIENDKLTEPNIEPTVVKIEVMDNTQMESMTVTYEEDTVFSEEDGPKMKMEDVEKETVLYEDIEYLEEEVAMDTKESPVKAEPLPSDVEEKDRRKKMKWPKKLPPNGRNKKTRKTLTTKVKNGKDQLSEPKLGGQVFKVEATDDTQLETVVYDEDGIFHEMDESSVNTNDVADEGYIYADVEYLEDEEATENKDVSQEPLPSDGVEEKDRKKAKWPKKLPPNERNKRYLQYTADDIRDALDAVRTNRMTTLEASQFYKVPKKTLAGKLRIEKKGGANNTNSDITYNFIKEIKTILTYTNGTPYRSKISQYSCMYCVDTVFDEPAPLRNHTRTVHMDERTKKVDLIMRPHWQNEILKLDIDNLLCVVCCIPIYDWNGMFQHLRDSHQVVLDHAYRRVIPYILGPDMECALCKQKFLSYHQLDGHMNTHYDNNVCGSCGDTFLTLTRLKAHMKTHEDGSWPCKHCTKLFNTDYNRRKHEEIVHKRSLFYRCPYCDVRFTSEKDRKYHVLELHEDKISVMTCELCGKTFKWKHDFTSHVKKVHGDKKFECSECGKKYYRKDKLEHHLFVTHRGEKRFSCDHCHKLYSSKSGLYLHMKQHHVD